MFARYENAFSRDAMGTLSDWCDRLPQAIGEHAWQFVDTQRAVVRFAENSDATLTISWRVIEPRKIALMSLPRLHVEFMFVNVSAQTRDEFMARFDLYMQRGGG